MTRFRIGNLYLDLPEGLNLQFQKTNILFAFDDAKCERSTSFDVPATANNDAIFAFSRDEHNTGAGMRVRYGAVLECDGTTRDGYLYVTEYDTKKKQYKCIFVTGELLGLLTIRQLGKLKDWVTVNNWVTWNTITGSVPNNAIWANIQYLHQASAVHPSWSLGKVIKAALDQGGVAYDNGIFTDALNRTRVIVKAPQTPENISATFASTVIDSSQPVPTPEDPYNTFGGVCPIRGAITLQDYTEEFPFVFTGVETKYLMQFCKPLFNLHLTFPSDFSSNIFILTQNKDFLGDYSFNRNKVISGTPLAGRTVDVPLGTPFLFVNIDDYYYTDNNNYGWQFEGQGFDRTYTGIVAYGDGDVQTGERVWLQDNLPDLTVVELLKAAAYITGKVLSFNDTQGVIFADLDFSASPQIDVSDLIVSEGSMSRKFGNYAQHNILGFKDEATVQEAERVRIDYTINNANIEEQRELFTVPFSEGKRKDWAGTEKVYVMDAEEQSEDVIAYAADVPYMNRITLSQISGLQTLLTKSTSVDVQAIMPLWRFSMILAKTVIFAQNIRWVWTEANWQKGIAKIKMSKI